MTEIRYRTFENGTEIVPVEVVAEGARVITVRVPGFLPRNKRLVRYSKADDFTRLHRTPYLAKQHLINRLTAEMKALREQIHKRKLDLRRVKNMKGVDVNANEPPTV